ncbi:hypothetical protein ACFXJJ_04520 [Streptomyces sp. NPDC059233]
MLTTRLAEVERRIEAEHPAIVVGGRRLAKVRHHLADAGLTETGWRERRDSARMFLTADGESGAPHGNYTISVDPADGKITIVLPEPLRHLANAPRGRYRLACTVTCSHRGDRWLDRATANKSVRYDITHDPVRGRWYLDASWSTDRTVPPTPAEPAAAGVRLLAVDLNADHFASWWSRSIRPTPHAGAADTGRPPSSSNRRPPSPGITVPPAPEGARDREPTQDGERAKPRRQDGRG